MLRDKSRKMKPDYEQHKKELKGKIRAVRNRLIQELDELFDPKSHIYATNDKFVFYDEYATTDCVMSLMESDGEFHKMIKETHPIIRAHINALIANIFDQLKQSNFPL